MDATSELRSPRKLTARRTSQRNLRGNRFLPSNRIAGNPVYNMPRGSLQRTRDSRHPHFGRNSPPQNPRTFRYCGSSSVNIMHYQNLTPLHRFMLDHSVRAPDGLPALVADKAGLRRCFAFPFECSPLAKLAAMQRHRDYADTVAQEIALKLVDHLSQAQRRALTFILNL